MILDKKFDKKAVTGSSVLILGLLLFYFTTSFFKMTLEVMAYHLFSMLLFGLSLSVLIQKSLSVLDNRLFKYLGRISYGIYMFHAIMMQAAGFLYLKVFSALNFSAITNIILFNMIVIILTIAAAGLSYKYYESFFLKRKHLFRRQTETETQID